ncbi:hypothetical protein [Mailhella massiliensis]|uniref:hypothetical protein n=1 Tax=Mailhella massiliensis TaxID=1903261 RepID=UPI0023F17426|nr:hypothetical protein [Mailhella massiliensis]
MQVHLHIRHSLAEKQVFPQGFLLRIAGMPAIGIPAKICSGTLKVSVSSPPLPGF